MFKLSEEEKKNFSLNLRNLMKQKDLSYNAVAIKLQCEPREVMRWAKGEAFPQYALQIKLAECLGILSFATLLTSEEDLNAARLERITISNHASNYGQQGTFYGSINNFGSSHDTQKKESAQQSLLALESAIVRGYYSSAQEILRSVNEVRDVMSLQEQARLKYLEALICLEGKRPSAQTFSIMRRCEELLEEAISLYKLYSYLKVLAILKQDFIQSGIAATKYRGAAKKLSHEANQLQRKSEDQENLRLFFRSQPQLEQNI